MTEIYKTKCPNCDAIYKVGINQIAIGHKQARCKRCKHLFVMRDSLVTESLLTKDNKPNIDNSNVANHKDKLKSRPTSVTRPSQQLSQKTADSTSTLTIQPDSAKAAQVVSNANSDTNTDDLLIHDDMDNDDETDEIKDLERLQDEWSEENLLQAAQTSKNKGGSTFFNTPDDEDTDTDDNAWLEDLLKEETSYSRSKANNGTSRSEQHNSSTDSLSDEEETLNSLLDELGVDTAAHSIPDHEQSIQRMQQRLQTKAIGTDKKRSKRSPIAILLWALGCLGLLLLLPVQYILFNMDALVRDPDTRPTVESFCEIIPCTVPNTDLTQFVVPQQTVKASADDASQSDIIATLVNVSPEDQLYPALKVSVIGSDGVVGEFIAEPKDYLVVPQRFMSSHKIELFMLSIDIPASTINRVEITPMY